MAEDEKLFTQADVNRMMAAEKESGPKSILKELGVEDVSSAKEGLQKYQEYLNAQKTTLEQVQEQSKQLQANYDAAVKKATHAESCMTAVKLGANTESIEDLVALASSKVTSEKSLETVLTEMKTNSAYSGIFVKAFHGTGQGGMQSKPSGGEDNSSLAKTLAERSRKVSKSSYFKIS
jgi:hypothetical protein